MKISPLDIKKQEFAVKFRGYSPYEVHAYLEMIAAELEDALRKNLELEQRISSMGERLNSYARMESILQETLITTQRAAEETKASAEKRSETLISEAHMNAQRIVNETNETLVKVRKEIADLVNQRENFMVNFRSLLESQLALLESLGKERPAVETKRAVPRKVDLTDEELEKIVDEFEKSLKRGSAPEAP